jgi:hypothetical protein
MKSQGKDVDFYTYVGIPREDASTNDAIARAYRKRSLLWQYCSPWPLTKLIKVQIKPKEIGKRHRIGLRYLGRLGFSRELLKVVLRRMFYEIHIVANDTTFSLKTASLNGSLVDNLN